MPLIDEAGRVYGRLTVLERAPDSASGRTRWRCVCDCGRERVVTADKLRGAGGQARATSCGCASGYQLHGWSSTPTYHAWAHARQRCGTPTHRSYPNYGGRGISVCARWDSFPDFLQDMGPRPSAQHSLDRIDNDGDYEPSNCRWATAAQQMANRRCTSDPCAKHRAALEARIAELEGLLCQTIS